MQSHKDHSKQQPENNNLGRLPFSKAIRNRTTDSIYGSSAAPVNLHQSQNASSTTPRMLSPIPSSGETTSNAALIRQNQELRQRLAEESHSYRRRIDTFKLAQQNQAALVSRLQSKVQQYRQRCSDLEGRMNETLKAPPFSSQSSTLPCQPKITTGPTTSQVMVRNILSFMLNIFFKFSIITNFIKLHKATAKEIC